MKIDTSVLKTVDKTLQILELFVEEKREMGISEISEKIRTNKSTTYRMLNTLRIHGFVQQNSDNSKYRLGLKCLAISESILRSIDLRDQARPFLEQLRDKTNETVNLVIPDEGMAVYIDKVESPHRIQMVSSVGTREEFHCTAVGKSLLAFLPDNIVDNILKKYGLLQKTSHTITDINKLKDHLKEVRLLGYSIDDEEAEEGVRCVGAPIFDHNGKVIAAISISALSYRSSLDKLKDNAAMVIEIAQQISKSLGNDNKGEYK